jgi:pre-mRNA-splicing factor SPF27
MTWTNPYFDSLPSMFPHLTLGTAAHIPKPRGKSKPKPPRDALARAYASHTYLSARRDNLELLDAWGRNAWLVSNSRAEAEAAGVERELAAVREETETLAVRRRALEAERGAEIGALEAEWKKRIGDALEAEAGAAGVRMEVREAARLHASEGAGGAT